MSVGLAGQKLGYCPKSAIVVGIPMATLSKSPYRDINIDYHLVNMEKMIDNTRKNFVVNRQTASGINFDYGLSPQKVRRSNDGKIGRPCCGP